MYVTRNKAQATVEYFILFIVLAAVTLLTVCNLYPRIKEMGKDFYQQAENRVLTKTPGH